MTAATTRDYTLAITLHTDHDSALRAKEALETTLVAIAFPNKERASALFKLGAECVVVAAQEARA